MKKIIFIIFLGLILALLYSYFIEPKMLNTKEIAITNQNISPSYNGLKIIHFTDFHYKHNMTKTYINKILKEINLINPDIIVFTGDLFDEKTILNEDDIKILEEFLSNINAKYGKYAIFGNHDENMREEIVKIYAHSEFILLENSYNIIYNKSNDKIFIGGIDNVTYNKQDIESTMEYFNTNEHIYTILLLHEPDYIDEIINNYNIDLALAGHSHAGQVRLPIIGAIYTPPLAKKYKNEHYKLNNTNLYISSGIGGSTLDLRFLCPPSINFYRITN